MKKLISLTICLCLIAALICSVSASQVLEKSNWVGNVNSEDLSEAVFTENEDGSVTVDCTGRQYVTPYMVFTQKFKLDKFSVKFKVTEQMGGWFALSFRQKVDHEQFIPTGEEAYGDGMFIIYTSEGIEFANGTYKAKDVQAGVGMFSTTKFAVGEEVTFEIFKDDNVGYKMYINGREVTNYVGDGEKEMDLTWLDEYFPDGEFYFTMGSNAAGKATQFVVYEINGEKATAETLPAQGIGTKPENNVSSTTEDSKSSSAVSSGSASSSVNTSSAADKKGGCGNSAE